MDAATGIGPQLTEQPAEGNDEAPQSATGRRRATVEGFLEGSIEVMEVFRVDMTYRVVARWRPSHARRRLSPRERRVLERRVGGQSQKEIGYDLGVALTTVSEHLRVGLNKLGIERLETAVVAVAALRQGTPELWQTPDSEPQGETGAHLFVVRAELAASVLETLTAAERQVALLAADGLSNAEIGLERRSSPRTVANQVASAFRKLRAHGRLELIRRLLLESAATPV
jgi:DNA-binding NarL/FixJ family response regulator